MRRKISLLLVLTLLLSLALTGCGKQNSTTLSAKGTVIYGKVTEINGEKVSFDVVSIPDVPNGGNNQGTPPEMPNGDNGQGNPPEMPSGDNGQNTPPEKPDGGNNQGTPPEMPNGGNGQNNTPEKPGDDNNQGTPPDIPGGQGLSSTGESGTVTIADPSVLFIVKDNAEASAEIKDISVGKILKITFDESGKITKIVICDEKDVFAGGNMGGPGGQSSAPTDYDAANKYDNDISVTGESLSSTGKDENAVLVTGGTVTLDNVTVTRTSSDSTGGDNASFYGVGAAVLATDGTLNIKGSKISTDASGGAGVFAYGKSVVTVSDTTISTKQNTSGGIHAAGGGTLYANNLTVTTEGESAAAIRSDRGGGTMRVNGGSYTSNGTGSPAIYCTADIAVKDSKLVSTNSEAICIEGKNNLCLFSCELSGNMQDLDVNDSTWTVIVYQSMSGDAEVGSGSFQMVGGKLISENGGLFYTTNTTSHILLSGVEIEKSADSEYLLACLGNTNSRGWGSKGKNGADCTFTAVGQSLDGAVLWDSVSNLEFYLIQTSVLSGAVIQDESYAGEGGNGHANVYIDSGSKWIVDGNSTVSNLYNAGTIVDANGKTVSIVGTDGTKYVTGESNLTITVNSYSTTVDLSGADNASNVNDFDFR